VQYDVASALHVFQHLQPTIVPMEITGQTALRRAYLPELHAAGSLGQLLAHQAEAFARDERYESRYGLTCSGLPDDIINFQHDALACAVAMGWDGVTIEQLPLRTEVRDGLAAGACRTGGQAVAGRHRGRWRAVQCLLARPCQWPVAGILSALYDVERRMPTLSADV